MWKMKKRPTEKDMNALTFWKQAQYATEKWGERERKETVCILWSKQSEIAHSQHHRSKIQMREIVIHKQANMLILIPVSEYTKINYFFFHFIFVSPVLMVLWTMSIHLNFICHLFRCNSCTKITLKMQNKNAIFVVVFPTSSEY